MINYPTGTFSTQQAQKQLNFYQTIHTAEGTTQSKIKKPFMASQKTTQITNNKYAAQKTVIDGITFDSKIEGKFYQYLKQQSCSFKYHQRFIILDKFQIANKKKRARYYTPDFIIYKNNFSYQLTDIKKVIDVKGTRKNITRDASLRFAMFESRYHIPIYLAIYNYQIAKWVIQLW